ncbi:MAG TPA: hypothetical protein VEA38_01455 [Terriglobales bacterium]|nr:hypothetical protein [Terriglobales bacterium]
MGVRPLVPAPPDWQALVGAPVRVVIPEVAPPAHAAASAVVLAAPIDRPSEAASASAIAECGPSPAASAVVDRKLDEKVKEPEAVAAAAERYFIHCSHHALLIITTGLLRGAQNHTRLVGGRSVDFFRDHVDEGHKYFTTPDNPDARLAASHLWGRRNYAVSCAFVFRYPENHDNLYDVTTHWTFKGSISLAPPPAEFVGFYVRQGDFLSLRRLITALYLVGDLHLRIAHGRLGDGTMSFWTVQEWITATNAAPTPALFTLAVNCPANRGQVRAYFEANRVAIQAAMPEGFCLGVDRTKDDPP